MKTKNIILLSTITLFAFGIANQTITAEENTSSYKTENIEEFKRFNIVGKTINEYNLTVEQSTNLIDRVHNGEHTGKVLIDAQLYSNENDKQDQINLAEETVAYTENNQATDNVLYSREKIRSLQLLPADMVANFEHRLNLVEQAINIREEEARLKAQAEAEAQNQAQSQTQTQTQTQSQSQSQSLYTLDQFMVMGVVNWNGYKYTYYSQSVLPGNGLSIPGRHVNQYGYVCDGDGYIVLANDAPKGTIFPTPFGAPGKVYDRGTSGNHLDVYIQ